MSFEFRMSTKRRGTPGAKSSPFTRKLSITISTMTPVAVGASGSRGASRLGWASTGCSVSISTSHLGGYSRFPIVEPSPVFAAFAEEASPLRLGQRPHDGRIELSPGVAQDLLHGVLVRARLAVRPLRRHRDVGVKHGQDTSRDWYLLARYAAGIALTVIPLVVTAYYFRQLAKEGDLAEHAVADLGMPLHFFPVLLREVLFLQQHRLSDSPLPNVPQRCRLVHDGGLLSRDPHLPH